MQNTRVPWWGVDSIVEPVLVVETAITGCPQNCRVRPIATEFSVQERQIFHFVPVVLVIETKGRDRHVDGLVAKEGSV